MTPEAHSLDLSRSADRRLTAEYIAARALVDAATFDEAAPRILAAICETLGWEYGAFWSVDRKADALRCEHIWTAQPHDFTEFDAMCRSMTFARGVGLPGRVWATGQPAWIPDVVADTNFPRAAVAARVGLHGAFGFPLLRRGEVLGVMEFFSREIREPDAELLAMLAAVGDQIGMFMDRQRAQEELARFFMLSLDMLCVAGYDGYFKRVNPAWKKILGYDEEELLSRPYLDFIHPDDVNASAAEAQKIADGKETFYFENRYLHKDGTIRWLAWAAAPVPGSAGHLRRGAAISPSARRRRRRWRSTREICRSRIATSKIRRRASRRWSRNWRSPKGGPKRPPRPRARFSRT